ncbi:MAG: hypothetical protein R3A52_25175 [Polyangiales bacterium]
MQAAVVAAGVACVPATAGATHPDWEGEKGIEFQLVLGGGAFAQSSDAVFVMPMEDGSRAAFTGGFAARMTAGYRFVPYLSAGVGAGVQTLTATGQFSAQEAAFGASDSLVSWNVGLWVRFYPLSLLDRERRTNPRVFFQSSGDRRRMEPWFAVGVDFTSGIQRTREYTEPQNRSQWTTTFIGAPVSAGFDYRLTPQLAVGLAAGVTPMAGADTSRTLQVYDARTNILTRSTVSYAPESGGNLQLWVGAAVRYTLTF